MRRKKEVKDYIKTFTQEPTAVYLIYNVFLLEFSRIIFDKNMSEDG